ncbi:MAG: hypothetical protein ACREX9_19120 [Gammaproteobacteria bacterium]
MAEFLPSSRTGSPFSGISLPRSLVPEKLAARGFQVDLCRSLVINVACHHYRPDQAGDGRNCLLLSAFRRRVVYEVGWSKEVGGSVNHYPSADLLGTTMRVNVGQLVVRISGMAVMF